MLLAVVIGNTNVKLGLFRGTRLAGSWRLSSHPRPTADEVGLQLTGLLGPARRAIRRVAIASVVPPLEAVYRACSDKWLRREPLLIGHTSPLGFTVGYEPPSDVGADRLVNAAAALARRHAPVCVVDFGTAVTLDVVSRRRVYLGGAIAPGIEMAAEALFRRTTKLPLVVPSAPARAIGRSTKESLRAGLVLGAAAMVDGLLSRAFEELGEKPPVIATGGAASEVVPHCRLVREIVPDLSLEGVRIVAERAGGRR